LTFIKNLQNYNFLGSFSYETDANIFYDNFLCPNPKGRKIVLMCKVSKNDKAHSPDCNGILFLRWLEKSEGEKDIVESGK